MSAFRALMSGLIDYAGLFPPAKLDMRTGVRQYAQYRRGERAWMLGRFICPAGRLEEFEREVAEVVDDGEAWELSVLIGDDPRRDLDAALDFEERYAGRFVVPTVEMKAPNAKFIDDVADEVPEGIVAFFEIPTDIDIRGLLTAIAGTDHAAKIRTGGITPEAFPSPEAVANFIVTCHEADVPFKATAGLHHPMRHRDEKIGAMMHGFLNVFGAAIVCQTRNIDRSEVRRILEVEDPGLIAFEGDLMRVLDWEVSTAEVEASRQWAASYGSCSFDEPVEDLEALGLLERTIT